MTGGRVDESDKSSKHQIEEEKTQTCDEWFSRFVIIPSSRYILLWNILMTMCYLFAIIMDTLI